MSIESVSNQPSTALFEAYDDVQLDPYVNAVFEKMKLYSELLKHEFVGSDQINEIMRELDDEWDSLLRREAVLTGVMKFLPINLRGSEGDPVRDFYEDETVIFGGVMPVQIETKYAFERTDDIDEDTHIYELQLHVTREAIDSDGKLVRLTGTAALDDIVSLEFPNLMSTDRARNWLAYYHPDDMDDIEVSLLNSCTEECEMLLRLSDSSVDIARPHRGDTELSLRSAQALNIYTNSLFTFDREAPYIISVSGDALQPDDDGGFQPTHITGTTMSSLDRIVWLAKDSESESVLYPHVIAHFLADDKDAKALEMMVPISSINSLKSCRYDYFVGYGDQA
jgi:hypothetical protein